MKKSCNAEFVVLSEQKNFLMLTLTWRWRKL